MCQVIIYSSTVHCSIITWFLAPSTKYLNIAKELKDPKHHSIIDKVVVCC